MKLIPIKTALILSYIIISAAWQTHYDWKKFSGKEFSFSYPPDWELKHNPAKDIKFILLAPAEGPADQLRENVGLNYSSLGGEKITPVEFYESVLPEYKKSVNGYKLIFNKPETFLNQTTRHISYSGIINGRTVVFDQLAYIKNDFVYILLYTAEKKSYNKYLPLFEKFKKSFKVN